MVNIVKSFIKCIFKANFTKKIIVFLKTVEEEAFLKGFKKIGTNTFVQHPVTITSPHRITIGDNVSIASFVHMWGEGGIEIGDNVMIASHCAITSVTHNPEVDIFKGSKICKKIQIGNNVWVGTHSVILPGVRVGNNVVLGAGSLVNKDIPDNAVYAGIPVLKKRDLAQFN